MLLAIISYAHAVPSISGMVVNTGSAKEQTHEIWNEISVPVSVERNPGATMFTFDIAFDSDVLEYLSYDQVENQVGNILSAGLADNRSDLFRVIGAFDGLAEDSNKTGLLLTLKFRAIGTGTTGVTVNTESSYAMRMDGTPLAVVTSVSANITVSGGSPTVSVGSVTDVGEGWLVTLPVQISANPGIAGYVMDITYDDTRLAFVRCTNGSVIENLLASGVYAEAVESTIRVVGAQGADTLGDGVLFNLVFTVKQGASGNIPVKVGGDSGLLNAADQEIVFADVTGTVELVKDQSASISINEAQFDKSSFIDLTVILTPNGHTLQGITNGSYALKAGEDYSIYKNTITIKAGYLATLAEGADTLVFNMSGGTNPTLVITVQDGGATPGIENPFVDVKEDAWYYSAVMWSFENDLFIGTSATEFSPDVPLTRAMLVTVLAKLHGADLNAYTQCSFDDVDDGKWYTASVEWARAVGLVVGTGNNNFAPNEAIARQDLATILMNDAKYAGKDLPVGSPAQFRDYEDIADYAKEAVTALTNAGVISGMPGNIFDPSANATRAEATAMLYQYVEKVF